MLYQRSLRPNKHKLIDNYLRSRRHRNLKFGSLVLIRPKRVVRKYLDRFIKRPEVKNILFTRITKSLDLEVQISSSSTLYLFLPPSSLFLNIKKPLYINIYSAQRRPVSVNRHAGTYVLASCDLRLMRRSLRRAIGLIRRSITRCFSLTFSRFGSDAEREGGQCQHRSGKQSTQHATHGTLYTSRQGLTLAFHINVSTVYSACTVLPVLIHCLEVFVLF